MSDLALAAADPAGPDLALLVECDDKAVAARNLDRLNVAFLRAIAQVTRLATSSGQRRQRKWLLSLDRKLDVDLGLARFPAGEGSRPLGRGALVVGQRLEGWPPDDDGAACAQDGRVTPAGLELND